MQKCMLVKTFILYLHTHKIGIGYYFVKKLASKSYSLTYFRFKIRFVERKGFEPSIQLPAYTLSRRAPSTTRTPLYFNELQSYFYFLDLQIFCEQI